MYAVNAWIVIGFIVFLGVVGYWKGRTVKTTENFMVAGRSLGFLILFGTLMMSEYNIGTMIGYTRFGYTTGLWGAMLALICFFNLGVFGVVFAKRWKRLNKTSITDLFLDRYGPGIQGISGILFIMFLLTATAAPFLAVGKLFAVGLNLPEFWTTLLIFVAVLAITYFGGLISVAYAHIISFGAILIFVPILTAVAWIKGGGMESLTAHFEPNYLRWNILDNWNDPTLAFWPFILGIWIGGAFNGQIWPYMVQRMYAAKNEKIAFRAMTATSIGCAVWYIMPVVIAALVAANFTKLADPDQALGYAIVHWLPGWLQGILFATLFGTCLSWGGMAWNTAASMLSWDVWKRFFRPQATNDELLKVARYGTILIAVMAFFMTQFVRSVFDAVYLAVIFRFCLNFGGWAGWLWWKASEKPVMIVAAIGIVTAFVIRFSIPGANWIPYMNLHGNVGLFILGIILCMFWPASKEELKRRVKFFNQIGAPPIGKKDYLKAKTEFGL